MYLWQLLASVDGKVYADDEIMMGCDVIEDRLLCCCCGPFSCVPLVLQCWSYWCWMRIFPASLPPSCLTESCVSLFWRFILLSKWFHITFNIWRTFLFHKKLFVVKEGSSNYKMLRKRWFFVEPKNGPCCQRNTAVLCPVHTWVFLWFCSIWFYHTLFIYFYQKGI